MNYETDRLYRASRHGPIELLADFSGGNVQLSCMWPPRGPSFFVVFPSGQTAQAVEAAQEIAGRDELPECANITASVPGALAAGTMPRPIPTVTFGIPEVAHVSR